jgi:hypothetical protein
MPQGISGRPSVAELESLKKFVTTPLQLDVIQAVIDKGSYAKAAAALGSDRRSVGKCVDRIVMNAARRGHSPDHDMTKTTPEGFTVSGVSTMYDADGEVKMQWVKTRQEAEEQLKKTLEAVVEAFSDPKIKIKEIPKPKKIETDDLLTVYPMGDPHIGMYAWAEEAGEDFDVKIAERNLVAATRRLTQIAPRTKRALIVNVGDFYHSDNQSNQTSRSGHALDVDTRWANVLWVGVRAMRECIEAALKKHEEVHVINEIGNHDDHTAQVLTMALSMAYENNPRVTFDRGPGRFHYYRFGKVLIGTTHGDTVKPAQLGGVMATDKPEDWGQTHRRYWLTGHVHTHNVFELPGCHVESFRTLAAKDAWTASMGYRSGRDMYCIVMHREFGEIERHRTDILMIE